ncbi:hypothetical protein V1512DRAFT_267483 [Lipomyces arxii]|uniref:uncharacterized protein n=1 Tax=Lipomyces arxii TaxID=56418 RepID=UPI0034CE18ED
MALTPSSTSVQQSASAEAQPASSSILPEPTLKTELDDCLLGPPPMPPSMTYGQGEIFGLSHEFISSPPEPPLNLDDLHTNANPLLDDQERSAYSDFLDRVALDPDFMLDPALPESVPAYPFPFPSSSSAVHTIQDPLFGHSKIRSKSEIAHVGLLSPSSDPLSQLNGPPLTFDAVRSGQITIEDRATILRAAHRQQGLNFGSDPRFSQSGFELHPSPERIREKQRQLSVQLGVGQPMTSQALPPTDSEHVAASEILRQMSQMSQNGASSGLSSTSTRPQSVSANMQHAQSSSSLSDSASPPNRKRSSLSPLLPPLDTAAAEGGPTVKRQRHPSAVSTVTEASPSGDNKELLTEAQRRKNHISSEKKRRDAIKQGFDELSKLVPVLHAGGFSKSTVLNYVVEFLRSLEEKNEKLKALVDELEKED